MNKIAKYSKWLLASAIIFTAPLLSSCDDDDVIMDNVPQNFEMNLSSLNIDWNETEGVVDLAANDKWKAETSDTWIEIDPSRGNAGEARMYLNFKSNPYRLPRTGSVQVTCGDKSGVVTVTQAGCSDPSRVAPSKASLEVESLDYAINVIPFSNFAGAIEGNLGLDMASFAKEIDQDGTLEFFMVDKEDKWIPGGGRADARCSTWLDSDLNVTNWSGDGYPAIATFIQLWNDEEEGPILVIGRAPGVPENTEYTLHFGLCTPDQKRYTLFEIDVVFPKMNLNGEIIGTFDLAVEHQAAKAYDPTFLEIPSDAKSMLGCNSFSLCKPVAYDENGEFVEWTAGNGYWYDTTGAIGTWGDSAGWYIEYHGDEDPELENTFSVGSFPGKTGISGVSRIGLLYNGKVVMFNVNVSLVGEVPAE